MNNEYAYWYGIWKLEASHLPSKCSVDSFVKQDCKLPSQFYDLVLAGRDTFPLGPSGRVSGYYKLFPHMEPVFMTGKLFRKDGEGEWFSFSGHRGKWAVNKFADINEKQPVWQNPFVLLGAMVLVNTLVTLWFLK